MYVRMCVYCIFLIRRGALTNHTKFSQSKGCLDLEGKQWVFEILHFASCAPFFSPSPCYKDECLVEMMRQYGSYIVF